MEKGACSVADRRGGIAVAVAAVAAGGPDNVLVGTIGQLRRVHWWRQVAREHVSTIGRHELNSWAQQVARGALGRARTSREPVPAGSVGRSAPMKRRGDGGVRECSKEGSAVRNACARSRAASRWASGWVDRVDRRLKRVQKYPRPAALHAPRVTTHASILTHMKLTGVPQAVHFMLLAACSSPW